MRVLYLSRELSPHDTRFLDALGKAGVEVFALFLEKGSQLEAQPLPPGTTRLTWPAGEPPQAPESRAKLAAELAGIYASIRPDVVHAGPIQGPAYLAALAGLHPLVSMSWGSDLLVDAGSSPEMQEITRFALENSDALIGDCQAVARTAAGLDFPASRTVLFPWGVNLEQFTPTALPAEALRSRLGWDDCLVMVSTRNWEPLLGVDVLAKAFALAARQPAGSRLRLLILGAGSQEAIIQELLAEPDLRSRVHFAGRLPETDMPGVFRDSDLYISATHSDGSSVSLMQALACGLPVLVSDIPGNREWITPGRQGWLFADGDADELAAGMLAAAADRPKLAEMGQFARRLAEERADWRLNFPRLFDAYRIAMERANRE